MKTTGSGGMRSAGGRPTVAMVSLDQHPAAKEKDAALRHGLLAAGEDSLEEVENALVIEIRVRHVVVVIGLGKVFGKQGVVLVNLFDSLDQGLVAWEVRAVQETARVEFLVDSRVAPIDRDATRLHGLEKLLRGVPRQRFVLERDVELVRLHELELAEEAAGDRA